MLEVTPPPAARCNRPYTERAWCVQGVVLLCSLLSPVAFAFAMDVTARAEAAEQVRTTHHTAVSIGRPTRATY